MKEAIHEDELPVDCEIGRRILTLRLERESLLDVVWLSSSPVQIRELGVKVSELLGDEQTQLHRDTLTIVLNRLQFDASLRPSRPLRFPACLPIEIGLAIFAEVPVDCFSESNCDTDTKKFCRPNPRAV